MIGERVFLRHIVFEDGFELRPFRREFREFKCGLSTAKYPNYTKVGSIGHSSRVWCISRLIQAEVALFLVLEAVLFAEAQFLGDARDAEGLAGKSGAQDVVRGNVRHGHGMNVAVRALAVIGGVGDLGLLVPVGGEDALAARALEGEPEAADAAEEVNEQGRALIQFEDRIYRMAGI